MTSTHQLWLWVGALGLWTIGGALVALAVTRVAETIDKRRHTTHSAHLSGRRHIGKTT